MVDELMAKGLTHKPDGAWLVEVNRLKRSPVPAISATTLLISVRDMTPEQRTAHREFWLAWVERAQRALGALLAETIDETPATSDTVFECVNQLIDVEQQLSAVLTPEPVQRKWSKR